MHQLFELTMMNTFTRFLPSGTPVMLRNSFVANQGSSIPQIRQFIVCDAAKERKQNQYNNYK
jgi:hypothetical protein